MSTSNRKPFLQFEFEKIKKTGLPIIFGFLLATAMFSAVVNLVLFPKDVFRPVVEVTSGLLQSTLIVNLIALLIIIAGIIVIAGRLKWSDVGIRRRLIPQAILVTGGIWLLLQVAGLVVSFIQDGRIAFDSLWQQKGVAIILGALMAQVFGNALVEEIGFRGFLLPQLFLKFKRKWQSTNHKHLIAAAIIVSQLLFSLSHIPNRLFLGVPFSNWPLDFFTLLGVGVLYAFIYLRTGNLFIAIGIHALANVPAALFIPQDIARYIIQAFGLVIVFAWPQSWKIKNS